MKFLKCVLVSVYVIIVILLLLCFEKCGNRTNKAILKEKFQADVIMCIDCTQSMDNIINTIKMNAINFYPDLKKRCVSHGKEILSMRIKVIAFRDFGDLKPFETSIFFDMPEQESQFRSYVTNLHPYGGGDDPERGYDALGMAIESEWNMTENAHQVIILWTDNASHPLQPTSKYKSVEEMSTAWKSKMGKNGKRLIIFAPNHPTWTFLEQNWDKTIRHDVNFGKGLTDIDYEEMLKTLSESI